MSEASEIHHLFHEPTYISKKYSKAGWVPLLDTNSQVNSFIGFNLQPYQTSNLLLNDGYAIVPLRVSQAIAGGGNAITANDLIAFKHSSASLISSIIVKAPNGTTLTQENDGSSVFLREVHDIIELSKENTLTFSERYLGPYADTRPTNSFNKYGQIVFPSLTAAGVRAVNGGTSVSLTGTPADAVHRSARC
jgi:hypothetical protein